MALSAAGGDAGFWDAMLVIDDEEERVAAF